MSMILHWIVAEAIGLAYLLALLVLAWRWSLAFTRPWQPRLLRTGTTAAVIRPARPGLHPPRRVIPGAVLGEAPLPGKP